MESSRARAARDSSGGRRAPSSITNARAKRTASSTGSTATDASTAAYRNAWHSACPETVSFPFASAQSIHPILFSFFLSFSLCVCVRHPEVCRENGRRLEVSRFPIKNIQKWEKTSGKENRQSVRYGSPPGMGQSP